MASDKIKVAVRVRPFNRRELELGTQCVIEMDKDQTILHNVLNNLDKVNRKEAKTFAFDHCFYSVDPNHPKFASQETVFESLGNDILDNAFQGYNACIFAYGQTGSGKSYTMMGSQENKGIIPRLCDNLFDRIALCQTSELSYKVEVSYMEIYNEKVHDLLDPKQKHSLKVREHAVLGPYVDGLSLLAVTSFKDIDRLMGEGNKSRTIAATNMNSESSRSHAVFSVVLTQTLTDTQSGVSGEKVSRMSLVDLAGSERAVKTGAVGERLKEGSNINKSLTTLGLVISKLADQSLGKNKDKFVPYRDSVLTWLLKDNLGGNSKTVMVATVSPAADNYEETLSTLRYADRAKRIVNHAVVNEDPNARIIRELRQEVEALKEMLKHATTASTNPHDLHEKLSESEKLMKVMSTTWEEKLIKTEQVQHERQEALVNMGISVEASGIKVEKNKYYLVNLNDDPSLNELLVYYLKERTLVGGSCGSDIQLSGLGIQPQHCVLTIEENAKLYATPVDHARNFVNGTPVVEKTLLHNGDRILWGHHHFFRVNCPKIGSMCSEPQTPAVNIDYNFAREEFMQNELSNDPIQTAIAQMERQHEEDKQVALEKQRLEYERQFQQLRSIMSPSTPYSPYLPFDCFRPGKMTPSTPTTQMRVEKWAHERNEMLRKSLIKLRADIVSANVFVKEANFLAEEMNKQTRFSVTLQIPPANLSPNRKRGAFVSEPAILVKRQGVGSQVWSMEKLENKLVDMRDLYNDWKEQIDNNLQPPLEVEGRTDPFYETQEKYNLIGVANVFLEALFNDVKLDYQTPIISQQGEVAGRLQVELSRVAGNFPVDRMCEAASDSSADSSKEEEDVQSSQVTVRVVIKQATGLAPSLSHFVICRYTFWNHPDPVTVAPRQGHPTHTIKFNHSTDFVVPMTEEFIDHCTEGALSVEVLGRRNGLNSNKAKLGWDLEQHQLAKQRSLADRWRELSRKLEVWVEVQELNESGEYVSVEVSRGEVLTGGVYQLRQGQQRRIKVRVHPVADSGTLPIICQQITSIAVGSITSRSKLQKPLDSYQEEDLTLLRDKWSDALKRRRMYLDQQIQQLINKTNKSESECDREQSLVDQWIGLTEERNAVLVPAPGSGIPGAPAHWNPPPGMEPHIPVLFLDLNADDLTSISSGWTEGDGGWCFPTAGANSILPKEHGNKFYNLPIIRQTEHDVTALAAWDSSVHDSNLLNKVTDGNERVYLIVKTTVRLSHPAPMNVVLRKRLALNIYKRQSLTDRLANIRRKIVRSDTIVASGVTYELVSNIPKASEELEDRESLAQIAASGEDYSLSDGETYIEKYTRGVSAVENILSLDRLRQSVAVKELLKQSHPASNNNNNINNNHLQSMRKTLSVPNFSQLRMFESMGDIVGSAGGGILGGVSRSESVSDLNREQGRTSARSSLPNDETSIKPFPIARPTFLNLNLNLNTRLQPVSKPSPNSKMGLRMSTLHEETAAVKQRNLSSDNLIEEEDEDDAEQDIVSSNNHSSYMNGNKVRTLPMSRTLDSLMELEANKATPSTTSSGYGSEAASSTNLTNDDCISLRSISVDETPDLEAKLSAAGVAHPRLVEGSNEVRPAANSANKNNDQEIGQAQQQPLANPSSAAFLPGKVVRRKKSSSNVGNGSVNRSQRASYPQGRSSSSEGRHHSDSSSSGSHSSDEKTNHNEDEIELSTSRGEMPDWVCLGESVLIRPYNTSGVVAFIGNTEFAPGTWVGIELDAPTGKNDGEVQGVRYFTAKPKHGIFIRGDKLIQDKRGRAMRDMRRNSRGEGGLVRSRSGGGDANKPRSSK